MTDKTEIFREVQDILVSEFELDREEIKLETRLVDELDFDSIDAIDLAVRLEERSGQALKEEELKALRTINDIVELVYAKSAGTTA